MKTKHEDTYRDTHRDTYRDTYGDTIDDVKYYEFTSDRTFILKAKINCLFYRKDADIEIGR